MNDELQSPPRLFGILLAVNGAALILGGIRLLKLGDNSYFVFAGIGTLLAGLLIYKGKLAGARVYVATFLMMVVWSLLDVGLDGNQLFNRLIFPAAIGSYILSEKIKARLT